MLSLSTNACPNSSAKATAASLPEGNIIPNNKSNTVYTLFYFKFAVELFTLATYLLMVTLWSNTNIPFFKHCNTTKHVIILVQLAIGTAEYTLVRWSGILNFGIR